MDWVQVVGSEVVPLQQEQLVVKERVQLEIVVKEREQLVVEPEGKEREQVVVERELEGKERQQLGKKEVDFG